MVARRSGLSAGHWGSGFATGAFIVSGHYNQDQQNQRAHERHKGNRRMFSDPLNGPIPDVCRHEIFRKRANLQKAHALNCLRAIAKSGHIVPFFLLGKCF
jgi:hypothetical protein